ncbi:hypothetical protein AQUCO_11000041v1 [Aquilegia coerulea]|uniref:Uncharacterized protein ycf33 n=1 Tax=Aquilegia coerulea TaxID=218851 RepID=A0A2G5C2X1_AQUCA|nr:hypothetical protein AQUCO_11000041v1 [Aquilegia coerulea]
MKTCILRSHFNLPSQSYLSTSPPRTLPSFLLNKIISSSRKTRTYTKPSAKNLTKESNTNKPIILKSTKKEIQVVDSSNDGYSRFVMLGAVSFGFAMLLAGLDDQQKALAFGPEGPLMEDFWDNMRRYGLYALTVSTGALSIIFQPIFELLKNPISAVLVIVILVGIFYIVTQVVSAMVGVSEFAYEYGY